MRWIGLFCMLGTVVLTGCTVSVREDDKERLDQPRKEVIAPAAVRKAECRWRNRPIRINGVLDDVAWEDAQELKDFSTFWAKKPAATKTVAKLLWDDSYLYYCAEMEDADLFALEKSRNGFTWEDDVFELFFKPSTKKRDYYEFQVNALNTQLELYLPSRGAGGWRRFASLTKLGMESAVKLRGTLNNHKDRDKYWIVEGRIPWTAFDATGGRPRSGDVWKFALCRYDYSVDHEEPELTSSAPLTQRDFHRYEDYGDLTFVGRK